MDFGNIRKADELLRRNSGDPVFILEEVEAREDLPKGVRFTLGTLGNIVYAGEYKPVLQFREASTADLTLDVSPDVRNRNRLFYSFNLPTRRIKLSEVLGFVDFQEPSPTVLEVVDPIRYKQGRNGDLNVAPGDLCAFLSLYKSGLAVRSQKPGAHAWNRLRHIDELTVGPDRRVDLDALKLLIPDFAFGFMGQVIQGRGTIGENGSGSYHYAGLFAMSPSIVVRPGKEIGVGKSTYVTDQGTNLSVHSGAERLMKYDITYDGAQINHVKGGRVVGVVRLLDQHTIERAAAEVLAQRAAA